MMKKSLKYCLLFLFPAVLYANQVSADDVKTFNETFDKYESLYLCLSEKTETVPGNISELTDRSSRRSLKKLSTIPTYIKSLKSVNQCELLHHKVIHFKPTRTLRVFLQDFEV
ncbi:MAG: hypothetical protein K9H06_18470 [Melioribacteraceae bacterium]|nr:hypothetical protein [Melioribacteraceae bacterium]MCF8420949.1 hypothetical protein [Melioribacteraceae bacterium]